ncbi:biotin-dependent carboxyltransferase family protein [Pseudomonas guariconensis]|uniref:5-oxoprolinase subunit C family protein n=1 Tax=Pseudomonas guariconensis TaxID=1288410 RepID=UPI002D1F2DCB|nr:biotin-dependent carboxyltransferase family protein [Pseudomonas guariconensis]MEB3841813.1 biotin-dependent carboxyltransferase family protein [Pseudomonas guariconensis]MEB3874681.1 biotin-dependent carboxyltransferase family protein [Pseudomonas guariconensis]MEB3878804.1 biotin-dependent carboxyltransferase family protein [Pseudomonas guariconensis]MEB3896049.1 biotin-dependent carboxyltransferase family protein [Pseudomonas guariconensis]
MKRLTIESSTALCQLQDAGRFGVRHLGVTQGGALDWVAMYWANWLLGNALDAPVVEVTLGGFTLVAEDDCTLALAGGDLDARVDDQPVQPWRSLRLGKGQRLSLRQPRQGARAYVAAPGGFLAETVLGSCATVAREALGGLDGRGKALAKGQVLSFAKGAPALREVAQHLRPTYPQKPELELVMGAQIGAFSGTSLFEAFNREWTLDSRADRMGMRLLGPQLVYQGAPMISEGIPLGAVQVPPDGQPIVLLNDRQTIGGYPRLGALTPLALAQLAQCLPGAVVRFRAVVQELAWQQQQAYLQRWR